jgi:hypothetical protein
VFRSRERERERERPVARGKGERKTKFLSCLLVLCFSAGTLSKNQSICLLFSRLDAKLPGEPD